MPENRALAPINIDYEQLAHLFCECCGKHFDALSTEEFGDEDVVQSAIRKDASDLLDMLKVTDVTAEELAESFMEML